MIYTFDSRVRYSETTPDGRMGLHALLNYLQDCSTFQSEELGLGVEALHEIRRIWMLASWQVVIERYPMFKEEITIGTQAVGHDALFARRNFFIKNKAGEMLVKANTNWIYVNMDTGHAEPLEEACVAPYGKEAPLPMEIAPRKIRIPKATAEEGCHVIISEEHLDSNLHVNNGQYVRIAENALGGYIFPRQVRAEYKKAAVVGDEMIPMIYRGDSNVVVSLKSTNGEVFSVVEFTLA